MSFPWGFTKKRGEEVGYLESAKGREVHLWGFGGELLSRVHETGRKSKKKSLQAAFFLSFLGNPRVPLGVFLVCSIWFAKVINGIKAVRSFLFCVDL